MIEIRDTLISSTQQTAQNKINKSALIFQCHNSMRKNAVFLPAFIRLFDMDSQTIVFERQPEQRIIRYDNKVYEVQLPWMTYVLNLKNLDKCQVFCSVSQLNAMEDLMMVPSIPNISSQGKFCIAKANGRFTAQLYLAASTRLQRDRLTYLMNMMWDTVFNNEYPLSIQNLPSFVPEDVKAEILSIEDNITQQWHKWLSWWESEIDLMTAMKWDTQNKIEFKSILEPPLIINDDNNYTVAETVIFKFLEIFSSSLE